MEKYNSFEKGGFLPPDEWLKDEKEDVNLGQISEISKDQNIFESNNEKRSHGNRFRKQDFVENRQYKKYSRKNRYNLNEEEGYLENANDNFAKSNEEVKFMTKEELEKKLPFKPIEKLGQNFLINQEIAKKIVDSTIVDADVVEIGAGPANLTVGIAQKAKRVIGLEIYPGYKDIQEENLANYKNVEIITGDALRFDFKRWVEEYPENDHQIMGNIPFHISEPLLIKCAQLGNKINRISLLVGENLRDTIDASRNPNSENYSKLSFIASIYDVEELSKIDKNDFWPAPPVNGGFVVLSPRESDFRGKDVSLEIRRKIIQNPELAIGKLIKNEARRVTSSKSMSSDAANKYDRRQTKREIDALLREGSFGLNKKDDKQESRLLQRINLSSEVMGTPFNRLNNHQVRELAIALKNL